MKSLIKCKTCSQGTNPESHSSKIKKIIRYAVLGLVILVQFVFLLPTPVEAQQPKTEKERIVGQVTESLKKQCQTDKDWKGLEVKSVSLIKQAANTYVGLAEFQYKTETEKCNLSVTADSEDSMYNCAPPIKLLTLLIEGRQEEANKIAKYVEGQLQEEYAIKFVSLWQERGHPDTPQQMVARMLCILVAEVKLEWKDVGVFSGTTVFTLAQEKQQTCDVTVTATNGSYSFVCASPDGLLKMQNLLIKKQPEESKVEICQKKINRLKEEINAAKEDAVNQFEQASKSNSSKKHKRLSYNRLNKKFRLLKRN